jgi:hypothetical protein
MGTVFATKKRENDVVILNSGVSEKRTQEIIKKVLYGST